MLINGQVGQSISIRDRGLLYGDGVFRTLRAQRGIALHQNLHLQKIQQDCAKLGIHCPALSHLEHELAGLLVQHPNAIIKLIITRGIAQRGYAASADGEPTHLWDVSELPVYPAQNYTLGIALRICELRLSQQPRLAGIKHLNRLENVLAANEPHAAKFAEGLLLDAQGNVIEAIRSNVFIVQSGVLLTPDLTQCGVAGVQRDRVIAYAAQHAMPLQIRTISLAEVLAADEVFLVNSVLGLWSVRECGNRHWHDFAMAQKLAALFEQERGL
ncbi:MAG: aminodeoxychorismate lyase [Sideroxydans sp.]|nr:aminodeoxychorismate lyase [Sideroxydans sp.]